jgi:hypothetical protein
MAKRSLSSQALTVSLGTGHGQEQIDRRWGLKAVCRGAAAGQCRTVAASHNRRLIAIEGDHQSGPIAATTTQD